MSLVQSFDEWSQLREVIVGRADFARIPTADKGLYCVEYRDLKSADLIPSGYYPQQCIEETQEDLEVLVEAFEQQGIVVRRPDVFDHAQAFSSPDWKTDGQFNYCPRDLFFCAGNTIIESPMTLRARQAEAISFRPILLDYLRSGSRWFAAPKPRLLDDFYRIPESEWQLAIAEDEPVFDAANVLRIGRDILYMVSDSGNRIGAQWLASVLGPEYRVHACDNIYTGSHIDTTLTLVRPGLIVANPERVNDKNLPALFKNWDVIYPEDIVDIGYTNIPYASKWIGINFMMINPALAVVDKNQTSLIRELEKRDVDVLPLQLRHSRTMGGGFHCVTLDVRRDGELADYCS
jgi:N-dimethylarginine dimethylaminohydrolase